MTILKVRSVRRILLKNGYKEVRRKGSHRMYEGYAGGKRRVVTLPGRAGEDIRGPTLKAIIRQSGLSEDLIR